MANFKADQLSRLHVFIPILKFDSYRQKNGTSGSTHVTSKTGGSEAEGDGGHDGEAKITWQWHIKTLWIVNRQFSVYKR